MKSEHPDKPFCKKEPCPICQKPVQQVSRHIKLCHSDNYQVQCHVCHKMVSSNYLTRHISFEHHDYCNKNPTLAKAKQSYTKATCHICQKTMRKYFLKWHIDSIHLDKPNFKCSICEVKFTYKGELTKHLQIKHQAREQKKHAIPICQICGKSFIKTCGLNRHLASVHGTEKPYKCDK